MMLEDKRLGCYKAVAYLAGPEQACCDVAILFSPNAPPSCERAKRHYKL